MEALLDIQPELLANVWLFGFIAVVDIAVALLVLA